jgi:hypothetical protein
MRKASIGRRPFAFIPQGSIPARKQRDVRSARQWGGS